MIYMGEKLQGVCLMDRNSQRKQAVDFAHSYEMGYLIRYSVKPTSTHMFKQKL